MDMLAVKAIVNFFDLYPTQSRHIIIVQKLLEKLKAKRKILDDKK